MNDATAEQKQTSPGDVDTRGLGKPNRARLDRQAIGYSVALVGVLLATLVRFALHPWLGNHTPYVTYILAVVLVSWRAGFGPGLFATALGGFLGVKLFSNAAAPVAASGGIQQTTSLALYFTTCVTVALISERLLNSRRRLIEGAEAARANQRALEREMDARREAEDEARMANDTTTRVLNSVADSIVALDLDWRVTLANDNALGLLAVASHELIGRPLGDFREALGAQVEAELKRVRETGQPARFESFAPIAGRWMEYRAYPTPEGVTFFALDVTVEQQAREAMQASEERYRMFVSQSSEAIWRFELERPLSTQLPVEEQIDWCYRYAYLAECNDAMARQYGYSSASEIVGRRLGEFLPREDERSIHYLRWFIRSGYRLNDAESVEVDREGNRRVFLNNLLGIVEDGCITRAWGTQRDVTERVTAQEEVMKLNAELERRVEERTLELRAANRELEAFCYSVSHDLRGPVRAVMASSMMLLEDYDVKLDDNGRRMLQRLVAGARNMGQLIEDLLELSKLQRADVHKQRVDLAKIAEEIAQEISSREAIPPIEFKIQPDMPAEADPGLTRVALTNLLENAAKFSALSEHPMVEIGKREVQGRSVFYVRDNGIGFDPQYAEQIFKPFERLHRPDEFPGSGIGLANVRRVVERHGGRIWAEAEEGKGATFFFTL